MAVTRDDILADPPVTGNPDTGIVRDITPGIADAIDQLVNPKPEAPAKERRVVGPEETR